MEQRPTADDDGAGRSMMIRPSAGKMKDSAAQPRRIPQPSSRESSANRSRRDQQPRASTSREKATRQHANSLPDTPNAKADDVRRKKSSGTPTKRKASLVPSSREQVARRSSVGTRGRVQKKGSEATGSRAVSRGRATSRGGSRESMASSAVSAFDIKELAQVFYDTTINKGVNQLKEEFLQIKSAATKPPLPQTDACKANPNKNRYRDVLCLDDHRVRLAVQQAEEDDYIHANYVGTDTAEHRFICTQAPMDSTTADFWRMIFQEKSTVLIMLCRTIEESKAKCTEYWPTKSGGTKTYGDFTILCVGSLKSVDHGHKSSEKVVSLRLEVRKAGVTESLKINHHQWITWPDKGVPSDGAMTVHLIDAFQKATSPIVVHCSAGIGRTGSLVVIAICLERLLADKTPVNISDIVLRVRQQRMHSVQTELQYLFVHHVLVNHCVEKGWVKKNPEHQTFSMAYQAIVARTI